ncbi:MAG: transcription antitermination factor NusB [Pseudomonadales bacterium]|nr:transcription antitermination factor NusB [Pseudomonadales bacterium]
MSKPVATENDKKPFSPWARRRARRLALQALYQWKMAGPDVSVIEKQFADDTAHKKVDEDYFIELIRGVIFNVEKLDELILPYLDRKMRDLGAVELSILRMVAFELSKRPDVPYKVAIDEGVELARSFGAEESHKYINGVADKLAEQLRESEKANSGKKPGKKPG